MAQILYLTGHSISLYHTWHRGAAKQGRFTCDEAGYRELSEHLQAAGSPPVSVLVDLIEEEFREETLPHTMGRDRRNLLTRQAAKLFRATPFRFFRVVGRQREGRRDDQVLFSALINRDNIEPLLNVLNDTGIPVRGVYSLPIITRRLLKALGAKAGNILVVTEQPDGGLRETFIRGGRVHFSRLAPVHDKSPDDYRRLLAAEAHKTRRYLNSLRLLPPAEPLEVYALCDTARVEALRDNPVDEADINIHPLSLSHTAQLLGFSGHEDSQYSDTLFSYLLTRRITPNHYAPASYLRRWHTHAAKVGLAAATWLLAVGAVVMSGMNIVDGRLVEQETRQLGQLASEVRQNYRQASQKLAVTPLEAVAMREALQLADRLGAYPVNLKTFFTLVGTGFSQQPDFVMDSFSWVTSTGPDAGTSAQSGQTNGLLQISDKPFLVSHIRGHVRRFNGSYRQAHAQLDRLVHWLGAQPGVRSATVVSAPLNTRADTDLQGGIATRGDKESAKFELRVVMEIEHEPV